MHAYILMHASPHAIEPKTYANIMCKFLGVNFQNLEEIDSLTTNMMINICLKERWNIW